MRLTDIMALQQIFEARLKKTTSALALVSLASLGMIVARFVSETLPFVFDRKVKQVFL